jgi:hypothetical protein
LGQVFCDDPDFDIYNVFFNVSTDLLPGSCYVQHQPVYFITDNGKRHDCRDARLYVVDVSGQIDKIPDSYHSAECHQSANSLRGNIPLSPRTDKVTLEMEPQIKEAVQ